MKVTKNKQKYNCKDIEKFVQKFIDNQLSIDDTEKFKQHLDYCLPCDKKLEFEMKLKEIIKIKAKSHSSPENILIQLKKIIAFE